MTIPGEISMTLDTRELHATSVGCSDGSVSKVTTCWASLSILESN